MPHNHHNFEYIDAALRKDLARRIAMGLAGWEYCKSARGVGYLADEDAARVEICEIIQAQRHAFFVRKDVVPENWKEQTRQVDIGIGIIDDPDPVKYGAIELKWSSGKFAGSVREDIIQDVARLASVKPEHSAVRLLVMGGGLQLKTVFDEEH